MKGQRIVRLLNLLQTLQSGETHNAASLAEACGVSRRTIFRDIAALRESGVPLSYDRKQDQYSLPITYLLPSAKLTSFEAVTTIVLATQMGGNRQIPFFEAAREAAHKIKCQLPKELQEEIEILTSSIQMLSDGVSKGDGHEAIYRQLLDARTHRQVVRLEYKSLTEWETITTKLRIYQLLYSKHSWYVVGRSSLHKEVRTFKIARIAKLETLQETYALARGFSLRRYLRNAWRIVPEGGRDQRVVVRFSPLVANNVAEVSWHPTQELEWQKNGSLLFHATLSGLNEFSWWVLGYADQAEVLKPARLRKLVADRAKSMAKLYS